MKQVSLLGLCALFAVSTGSAFAATDSSVKAMAPILDPYYTIGESLAADSLTGVALAAQKIAASVEKIDGKVLSKAEGKRIKDSSLALEKAKDLKQARELFKGLSAPLTAWAKAHKPAGVHKVFCSMANASWLQRQSEVRNPYYGKSMLECGELDK
ncbi:DUF3347 domain-containing protein [Bdellovibrionota bacterium FG-2]